MVHHMVMARRQVLVQLDDELVERLDRIAVELGTSRSALVRAGALAFIDAAESEAADRALVEAYRAAPPDQALLAAARRLAARSGDRW